MKSRALVAVTVVLLAFSRVASAETGLIERRFATPAIARFMATTTEDGRLIVRSESDEARPEVADETRWFGALRDGWRRSPLSFPSIAEMFALPPSRPVEDDGFDAIFCERVGALKLFLDAPPTLTGDDSKPLGARIEPNRVDGYFLSDDCVSVGLHGSIGRLWLEGFLCANTYSILPMDPEKFIEEKRVLGRREPHRLVGRASLGLTADRRVEVYVEAGTDHPLDKAPSRAGVRGGLRFGF